MEPLRTTLLSATAGLLLLASAAPAVAMPLDLLLKGHVTGSASSDPAAGEAFGLELWLDESDLSTMPFFPHLITDDAVQLGLVLPGDDYRYDDGVWFRALPWYIDSETGDALPLEDVDFDNPLIVLRVILEIEAFEERAGGQAPDSVWAQLELWYPARSGPTGPLGDSNDFLAALRGGEVELRSAGETVLTGELIPEPNTALLLGLGLTALAASRSRRQALPH